MRAFCSTWLIGLSLATLAAHAQAAAFDYNDASWQGTAELLTLARSRLGNARVRLVANLDYSVLTPRDGVLVLHPKRQLHGDSASNFMRKGGRMAVADDYGSADSFYESYAVNRQNAPIRPSEMLRGNPNLAWAVPSDIAEAPGVEHPLIAGVQRVLTNHPMVLVSNSLTPILQIRTESGQNYVLAYSALVGKRGRLLAVGDPSIFINLMLRYPGNRAFAGNLISYLVQDDTWGPRGGTLYLVSNDFTETEPDLNVLSGQSVRERFEQIRRLLRDPLPEGVAWGFGLLCVAWLGHWAYGLFIRQREVPSPRFVQGSPLIGQPGEVGHAAVLAAPTSPRQLTLLEIAAAAGELLQAGLSLETADLKSIQAALQDSDRIPMNIKRELPWLTEGVGRVHLALVRGRITRVSQKDLERAHRLLLDIAEYFDHRLVS